MKKWMMLGGAFLFTLTLIAGFSQVGTADETITIGKVMKEAMKGGLCKKVASGEASDAEKKELLAMFEGLAKAKPPMGEADSWKEKTGALVAGAKAAVDGKPDAGDMLKKAANCKACHDVHKGQ